MMNAAAQWQDMPEDRERPQDWEPGILERYPRLISHPFLAALLAGIALVNSLGLDLLFPVATALAAVAFFFLADRFYFGDGKATGTAGFLVRFGVGLTFCTIVILAVVSIGNMGLFATTLGVLAAALVAGTVARLRHRPLVWVLFVGVPTATVMVIERSTALDWNVWISLVTWAAVLFVVTIMNEWPLAAAVGVVWSVGTAVAAQLAITGGILSAWVTFGLWFIALLPGAVAVMLVGAQQVKEPTADLGEL
ncbi:MAG: hypothetical protein ACOC9R_02680 [bacterium]